MANDVGTGKKIVCITGTVWTGNEDAPRKQLVEAGFARPVWFTTEREITDARYYHVTDGHYHAALARHEVLAHTEYGGGHMGIMKEEFDQALSGSEKGVLVVGPPEIAARLAGAFPHAILFTLKCAGMKLAEELTAAGLKHRVYRIDVESWKTGAWNRAYDEMLEVLAEH